MQRDAAQLQENNETNLPSMLLGWMAKRAARSAREKRTE
jgi:hypothetical protein